jgi:hypothetical protein
VQSQQLLVLLAPLIVSLADDTRSKVHPGWFCTSTVVRWASKELARSSNCGQTAVSISVCACIELILNIARVVLCRPGSVDEEGGGNGGWF